MEFDSDIPLDFEEVSDESFNDGATEDAAAPDGASYHDDADGGGEPELGGRLKDGGVPPYPEESRVVKLLDGLRLDERATASLLLAAGNKYNMKLILEAIRIQYPLGRQDEAPWDDSYGYGYDDSYGYEAYVTEAPPDETETGVTNNAEYDDVVYDEEDAGQEGETPAADGDGDASGLAAVVEALTALTVTSRRLAEITKARGFYQDKTKGKGTGKASNPKGKAKGKSSEKGKSFKGFKGKGKGKPGPMPTQPQGQSKGQVVREGQVFQGLQGQRQGETWTYADQRQLCHAAQEKGVTVNAVIPEERIQFESFEVFQPKVLIEESQVHDTIAVSESSKVHEFDMLVVESKNPESNAVVQNSMVHEFDMSFAENFMALRLQRDMPTQLDLEALQSHWGSVRFLVMHQHFFQDQHLRSLVQFQTLAKV
eukprot:s2496_g7.t1